MTPEDFEFLSVLVRKRSGLVLSADKTYLLESRLTPVDAGCTQGGSGWHQRSGDGVALGRQ